MNNHSNGTGKNQDAQLEQELNGLRRQYEQLRDQRVRTEQQVTDLTGRLEALKARAEAEYGTSDPKELQALLEEKREENRKVVASYREHIQQIQADLAAVESGVGGDN
ncbi:hypothetical protein GM415_05650 [Pseudodesulfovibrio cashew]|uniref:DUF342 domain-containing protein n=1 Tax=Pseudodesulfovibrio cashew TaxID=2678688 RepID=A0A6I6JPQ9_9BACT|nr:hypothetical protein [Pseudodesulfovibrio cashew]QGY39624.1 hypothetical protein GM415_05650 [Pseudodesulfovibrio cashew]